jgi:hypothetical protein
LNAGEFAKKRGRIASARGRSEKWKRKALGHLAREAGAVPFIRGGKVKSHRFEGGQVVCEKHRYRSQAEADADLANIQARPGAHQKPTRSFPCPHCRGFHLTHQAALFRA